MAMTTRWRMPPRKARVDTAAAAAPARAGAPRAAARSRAHRPRRRAAPGGGESPSVSWRPIVKTGFSAVIGSWKIMPILSPRRSIIFSAGICARSIASPSPGRNQSRPDTIRPPPNSTRRRSESEVTDLPEPLSPTTQTVSPGFTVKLTSFTPTMGPLSPSNSTRRFSMETRGCCGVWSSMVTSPSGRARRAARRREGSGRGS